MNWPVRNLNLWYIAQSHGDRTSYGRHDGEDWNLITGGNTDLGQPLHAIAEGEVTSVHRHTSTPTFGKHIHIKHDGPWGTIYSHYAHCDSINVAIGDVVHEGQVVATLGKSGSLWSHLHWSIKIKPCGIDNVPNNLIELNDCWIDPSRFINRWINYEGGDMGCEEDLTKCNSDLAEEQQRLVDCRRERGELENEVEWLKDENEKLSDDNDRLTEALQNCGEGELPELEGWSVDSLILKKDEN
ncbi:MAG: hypothetical protein DRN81_03825 [Thermoproteota archaeon]|nr:MAG: hypothetical protein DRN81_03825 [Candidatus Korarchaeota archaeon]